MDCRELNDLQVEHQPEEQDSGPAVPRRNGKRQRMAEDQVEEPKDQRTQKRKKKKAKKRSRKRGKRKAKKRRR